MKTTLLLIALTTTLGAAAQMGTYINPRIKVEANDRETAIKSYPYKPSKSEKKGGNRKGMKVFDEAMREKFSESNLDSTQAMWFYQVLENEKFLRDESYGMPSPNSKKSGAMTVEKLQSRVAVKKVQEGVYDILYYKVSCGKRFHHMRLYIKAGSITKKQQIESWSASYPC